MTNSSRPPRCQSASQTCSRDGDIKNQIGSSPREKPSSRPSRLPSPNRMFQLPAPVLRIPQQTAAERFNTISRPAGGVKLNYTHTHTSKTSGKKKRAPRLYWMLCLLFSILFSQQSAFAGNGVINSLRTRSAKKPQFASAEFFYTVQFCCARRGFIFCKLHFDLPECFQSCLACLD